MTAHLLSILVAAGLADTWGCRKAAAEERQRGCCALDRDAVHDLTGGPRLPPPCHTMPYHATPHPTTDHSNRCLAAGKLVAEYSVQVALSLTGGSRMNTK